MAYKIISSNELDKLEKAVNQELKNGYKLAGGLSIGMAGAPTNNSSSSKVFAQALIKD